MSTPLIALDVTFCLQLAGGEGKVGRKLKGSLEHLLVRHEGLQVRRTESAVPILESELGSRIGQEEGQLTSLMCPPYCEDPRHDQHGKRTFPQDFTNHNVTNNVAQVDPRNS